MFGKDYISKDLRYFPYYEETTKQTSFILNHKHYDLVLLSDKIEVHIIMDERDRKMIELLGYWIEEIIETCNNFNFTKEDIYLYIRLKASTNQEFLEWWSDYNFQIYSFSYTKESMENFQRILHLIEDDELKRGF